MFKGESRGVYGSAGQDEICLNKTSQAYWLNQVSNKWERFLFQSRNSWRNSLVLEEARLLLVDGANLEQVVKEKWVNQSVW